MSDQMQPATEPRPQILVEMEQLKKALAQQTEINQQLTKKLISMPSEPTPAKPPLAEPAPEIKTVKDLASVLAKVVDTKLQERDAHWQTVLDEQLGAIKAGIDPKVSTIVDRARKIASEQGIPLELAKELAESRIAKEAAEETRLVEEAKKADLIESSKNAAFGHPGNAGVRGASGSADKDFYQAASEIWDATGMGEQLERHLNEFVDLESNFGTGVTVTPD